MAKRRCSIGSIEGGGGGGSRSAGERKGNSFAIPIGAMPSHGEGKPVRE